MRTGNSTIGLEKTMAGERRKFDPYPAMSETDVKGKLVQEAASKSSRVNHVVDDSGHYGTSYCGNCNEKLCSSSDQLPIPSECPNCGVKLVGHNITDFGGSDF